METASNGIGHLAAALAKAQGSMSHASKDKLNPHLKSKYADLASVWDACREPLAANGLAIVQLVEVADDGHVAVTTRLLHSSGESLSATCVVPVAQKTAQGIGSAITYARRYGLSAMVGVASGEDDDGHFASHREGPPPRPAPRPASQVAPKATPPAAQGLDELALEVVALRASIERATSTDELSALTARILKLPEGDRASLRDAYKARAKAVAQ